MKLLVNCDQVFEVLTRGPFPTGEPTDEAVEQHLGACHECRQLAEALRPAVALLHEAVSKEESLELPEYQGSLPEPDPFENEDARPLALGLRMLDRRPRSESARRPPVSLATRNASDAHQLINAVRLIAASVLVVALGWLGWGLAMSPRHPAAATAAVAPPRLTVVSLNGPGLMQLSALQLAGDCFPRGLQLAEGADPNPLLASAANAVRCCAECHHPGGSVSQARVADRERFHSACAACHQENVRS